MEKARQAALNWANKNAGEEIIENQRSRQITQSAIRHVALTILKAEGEGAPWADVDVRTLEVGSDLEKSVTDRGTLGVVGLCKDSRWAARATDQDRADAKSAVNGMQIALQELLRAGAKTQSHAYIQDTDMRSSLLSMCVMLPR